MMSKPVLFAFLLGVPLAACFSDPAEEPTEDARFIAEQHVVCDRSAEQLEELQQTLFNNLRPGVEKLGATIRDPDRFMRELVGEYNDTFLPRLIAASAEGLGKVLTPQELSELADFYRSGEGQDYLAFACAPTTAADFDRIDVVAEGPGAPLVEHQAELEAELGQFMSHFTSLITAALSIERMAEVFDNPQIIGFEDDALRAEVVEAMRQVGS